MARTDRIDKFIDACRKEHLKNREKDITSDSKTYVGVRFPKGFTKLVNVTGNTTILDIKKKSKRFAWNSNQSNGILF